MRTDGRIKWDYEKVQTKHKESSIYIFARKILVGRGPGEDPILSVEQTKCIQYTFNMQPHLNVMQLLCFGFKQNKEL